MSIDSWHAGHYDKQQLSPKIKQEYIKYKFKKKSIVSHFWALWQLGLQVSLPKGPCCNILPSHATIHVARLNTCTIYTDSAGETTCYVSLMHIAACDVYCC